MIRPASAFALALLALTCNAPLRQTPGDAASVVKGLREHMLTVPAEDLAGTAGPDEPFAVLMDVTNAGVTVSVFVTSSGDASIYTSNGGALLGGTGVPSVHSAVIGAVRLAASHMSQLSATTNYNDPADGNAKFFVRTRAGVRSAERPVKSLTDKSDSLSSLYDAVNDVRARMEKITPVQAGHIYALSPPQ